MTRSRQYICSALTAWLVFLHVPDGVRAATLPLRSYTTSDGLAHDRVNRIVRDSRGFLWFCTSEGLSRFDGYEFKNYTQDDGLPHRSILDLLETRDGGLWIATGDAVVFFDPLGTSKKTVGASSNDKPMFRVFRPADLKIGAANWEVDDLIEDRNGTIWVASVNGLYRLNRGDGDWELTRVDTEAWGHLSHDFTALLEDRTGAIWIGAERGLYRLRPDGSVECFDRLLRIGRGSFLEDRQGRIWAGSNGGESSGLYQFILDEPKNEARFVRVFDSRDGLSANNWINAIRQTGDGRIFVGVGNGLCEYTPDPQLDAKQFQKLFEHNIKSLGEDAGGNLWVGTESSGAIRIVRHGFVSYDESDGLRSKLAGSILTGSDGETYVLAGGFTISRFDGQRFTTVSPLDMATGNWGTNQITFQDHAGEWWVTAYNGLQRYPKVGRLEDLARTKPLRLYSMGAGPNSDSILQLFEDSSGDIWISDISSAEDRVHRWDRATDTIRTFTADDGFPLTNCPTSYGEDRAGNVWMGFYNGGLGRYRNGRFEQFTAADGVPPGIIPDIHTDKAGRVWIATSSSGALRIDDPTAEKPVLTRVTTAQGLASNQANCIAEDNFGRIYVGGGRGVSRLDLNAGRVKVFTKADGLLENMVSLCQADTKGGVWFATSQGLSRYVPENEEQTPPPPVFIGSIHANGEPAKKLSELGESSVKDVELASDQRQVQIQFFALGFSTGETLRYQYQLAGDAEWSEPSTQRTIDLNLAAGGYRFMVRAVTADGVLSTQPAVVAFSIAQPIWQRWWFLVLLTLVVAALFYVLYRYRLRRVLELERVRTRIATDLHDDIGSSLSQIAILSEVVRQKIGGGPVDQPLTMIADTSREMVDSMSDIVWAIDPNKDHLSDLVQRMRRFASDILDAREISYRFEGDEQHRQVSLGADVRREVYLIFKECVNNLVKHADATEVEMSVQVENRSLVVTIKDNGKGFDSAAMLDANGAAPYNGLGGNGLRNMRSRVANLGGEFMIRSETGEGTLIEIRIPVKAAPLAT